MPFSATKSQAGLSTRMWGFLLLEASACMVSLSNRAVWVVKQSAMTSHSPTARLDSDITQVDASNTKNTTVPPSKTRRFNSEWAKGREWLKHDHENGVIFCEWCRCFDRNEHRNQFVKGCASVWSLIASKRNSRGSTGTKFFHWCKYVFYYVLAKVWRPKLCNGNWIWNLVDTTGDLAIEPNFTHCNGMYT